MCNLEGKRTEKVGWGRGMLVRVSTCVVVGGACGWWVALWFHSGRLGRTVVIVSFVCGSRCLRNIGFMGSLAVLGVS